MEESGEGKGMVKRRNDRLKGRSDDSRSNPRPHACLALPHLTGRQTGLAAELVLKGTGRLDSIKSGAGYSLIHFMCYDVYVVDDERQRREPGSPLI